MIHLPQICLNFFYFFHRLGGKEILWEKRNFGDCKRIFEQAVVETLLAYPTPTNLQAISHIFEISEDDHPLKIVGHARDH
jgi:hypothetical protein